VSRSLAVALVSLVGFALLSTSSAEASADPTPAVIPMSWGPAGGDCSGQIALTSVPSRLRYTVWCGVESGPVHFGVRGPKGKRLLAFDRKPRAIGPGASGSFRCRRSDREITCRGRASGPLTITGTLTLAGPVHCSEHPRLEVGDGYYGGRPGGCPGFRERPPPFAGVKRFRREYGLDADLAGHPAAIRRRILGLLAAWRRGDPVARWTVSYVGVPMSAADQRLFDYHEAYINQFLDAIEPWVEKHASSTYAGYNVDHEHGGVIYLGFTQNQDATIAAFKRQVHLIAPAVIKPFPVPPTYTEHRLDDLSTDVIEPLRSQLSKLINSSGPDIPDNKVKVGTEHVRRVRELIAQKYGAEAPFEVVFEEPGGVLL
jgi:hypothetical protein